MPAVRALLLLVVACLFVMTVSLVSVAVLLALLVPRIQQFGRAASP